MKNENDILDSIQEARINFPYNKYKGALFTYEISQVLKSLNHNVSMHDCYIKGVNAEFDLLVLRDGVDRDKICFKPDEVLYVFEMKAVGLTYNKKDSLLKVQDFIDKVRSASEKIQSVYLMLSEVPSYIKMLKEHNFDGKAKIFILFEEIRKKRYEYHPTNQWSEFLAFMKR
jgi:hypothetical protein